MLAWRGSSLVHPRVCDWLDTHWLRVSDIARQADVDDQITLTIAASVRSETASARRFWCSTTVERDNDL
jgi:hypothetical protein